MVKNYPSLPKVDPKKRIPVLETRNGVVVPSGQSTSIEEMAEKAVVDACNQQYQGDNIYLAGKTNLEAAVFTLLDDAAAGAPDARREVLNRILGMPVQRQEVKSQNITLVSFLDQLAENPDGQS